MRRSTSSRPAVYVVFTRTPPAVLGTMVSCPGDLHRDTRRLFGPGAEAVAVSRVTSAVRHLARLADDGNRRVSAINPLTGRSLLPEPAR